MDQQELKNVIELHRKWVLGQEGGARANLAGAYLADAYLADANLDGANLADANLAGAYLADAYLADANLDGAYLDGAYLADANLAGANLAGAYLARANLDGANLADANLAGANLADANLAGANLDGIKNDFFKVLDVAKNEALGLYDALMRGNINGSQYEGECACLVGTIANVRKEKFDSLAIELRPQANRFSERWFLAIHQGDIPQSNPVSKITAEWMREWMDKAGIKYPTYEIVAKEF